MSQQQPTVYLIDDEPAVRESIRWLLDSVGLRVAMFGTAQEFLDAYDPQEPGCLVLDLRLPGMDGLALQELLQQREIDLPIVIVSGHADVSVAVRAMKSGAFDLLEKPFNDQVLINRVQAAIARDAELRAKRREIEDYLNRMKRLSPREYEVMLLVSQGRQNKHIAAELGVSSKTVEAHRANVMDKMEAGSLAELVKIVLTTGVLEEDKDKTPTKKRPVRHGPGPGRPPHKKRRSSSRS